MVQDGLCDERRVLRDRLRERGKGGVGRRKDGVLASLEHGQERLGVLLRDLEQGREAVEKGKLRRNVSAHLVFSLKGNWGRDRLGLLQSLGKTSNVRAAVAASHARSSRRRCCC